MTAFPTSVISPIDVPAVWKALTKYEPEKCLSEPRLRSSKANGEYERGVLSLSVAPPRIDLNWGPTDVSPSETADVPVLGPADQVTPEFSNLVTRFTLLEDFPDVMRLAFAMDAVLPVADRAEGYEVLDKLLHAVEVDAGTSQNLMYQINRPRVLDQGGISVKVNRLVRWSVPVRMAAGLQIHRLGEPSAEITHQMFGTAFTCGVSIDVNTAPDTDFLFDRHASSSVLERLRDFAIELCVCGDIP